MSKTISNIQTAQYNLIASGNPLTITSSGGVETPGAVAITGTTTQAWTVGNAGTVIGSYGIKLEKGGVVTNTGSIIVTYDGVEIRDAAGTVSNSGKILGGFDGVVLYDGGTVTNLAGGTIAGNGNVGVYLKGAAATLTNAGTISGSHLAVAVVGAITSRIIVDPGAVFIGGVQGGSRSNTLELAKGAGSTGTIGGIGTQFLGFQTIDVDTGATWSLINSGTLSGVSSLINHGTLAGGGTIDVSTLFNDGTIAAAAQLTVGVSLVNQGRIATTVTLASGATLDNSGTIIKTGYAVYATGAPAFVINSGMLVGYDEGAIILQSGGEVTNLSGGMIVSDAGNKGVDITNASGTVTNSGTIIGTTEAVYFNDGGTISNLSGGVLRGGSSGFTRAGVDIGGGSGTITNAGTIIGSAGADAVTFYGNFTDRLIVDPGAVFTGAGAAQGGSGSNTLELAAGTSGNTGTITGFSTQYLGFGTIDVDGNSAWSLVNAGTLASGTTLTDSGVLTTTGSLGEGGSVAVAGGAATGAAGGSLLNAGTLGVTGTIDVQAGALALVYGLADSGGVVTNSGTLTNAGTFLLDGAVGSSDPDVASGGGGTLTNNGVLINSVLISAGGGGGGNDRGAGGGGGMLVDSGTLLNAGTIALAGGAGGNFGGASGGGGMLLDSGTLLNAGTIALAGGGSEDPASGRARGFGAMLVVSGTLVNSGSLGIGAGATGGTGPGYAAVVAVTSTGTLSGAGNVSGGGSLINHGTILASGAIDVSYLFNDGTIGASATLIDAGRLVNQGSIANGVTLATGATLDNAGSINGGPSAFRDGVRDLDAAGFVTNSGTISGGNGIYLTGGGVVTNLSGASITGRMSGGVFITGGSGTVTNDGGKIVGASYAIELEAGGTVSNLAAGVLLGTANAAVFVSSGTVINAGTIDGFVYAVGFRGTANRLIIDPGAVFTGAVQGNGGSDTLELAPGSGGTTGTISGIGTQFTGFASLAVDAGADWMFDGSDTLGSAVTIADAGNMIFSETLGHTVTVAAPVSGSGGVEQSGPGRLVLNGSDGFTGGVTLAGGILELASGNGAAGHGITFAGAGIVQSDGLPTGTIHGFANTDTIDLPSYSYLQGAQATLAAGNTLVVQSGSETFDLLLDPTQDFGGVLFSVHQDAGTGILVEEASAPCYARGTQLLTAQGEVAIEALRVGDQMVTASGALRPIRWIGRRSYAGGTIGGNRDILPICLRAGALADGVPRRDLHVSPKHAMFLDGVLIPAELLVNGVSILQPAHVEALTYYHVELDSHDVLIAEGALSESFVDHDSRVMFDNAAAFGRVHPARREDCVPRVEDGEVLARVRQRIAARAGLGADHADDAAEEGPLDGRLDLLDASGIAGWAFDARRPHTPIRLDILDGERVIGTVVANRFRPDLRPAGKGDGRCAYVFRFDTPPANLRGISLRRSSDGAMLPAQEAELRAA